ncbi:MAG: helix-turn-helix domain-containing protein [Rhodospirillaceae bacterium]
MSTRLAILHASWLEHPEVGADEVAVLAVLALHADRQGSCFPSQGLLATLLGRSRPWVCKVISTLCELGILQKTNQTRAHDGSNRACLYKLIAPDNQAKPPALPSQQSHEADSDGQPENRGCHSGDSITPKIKQTVETPPACDALDLKLVSLDSTQAVQVATIPGEDWQPTDESLLWAFDRYPDTDLQAARDRYVNKCRARGYKYICHDSAWRSWLADDVAMTSNKFSGPNRGRTPPTYARFAAWGAVAAHATERPHAY